MHEIFKNLKLVEDISQRYPGVEGMTLVRKMSAQDYAQRRAQLLQEVSPQLRVDESAMPAWPLTQSTYFIVDEVSAPAGQARSVGPGCHAATGCTRTKLNGCSRFKTP